MQTFYVAVPGRSYRVVKDVPADPQAIVIAYHGAGKSGEWFAGYTGLHRRGAAAVVAYPSGWWATWEPATRQHDVAMTSALIARLWQSHGQLPVYTVGHSAGATMALRAAVECDVARVAAVSAGLNPTAAGHAPASYLHVHGDNDPIVPFAGGGPFNVLPSQPGIDLLGGMGAAVDRRLIVGGVHNWNMNAAETLYDTTGAILAAWGLIQ